MHVAITGASGFIGRALAGSLAADGHRVRTLVRTEPSSDQPDAIFWDPARGILDPAALTGVDAVVHLAGAGIGDRRWSDARKQEILESRTKGTELLARALAEMDAAPAVLVSASGVGFYGDRGDEDLTEASSSGTDFLSGVVRAWEAAAQPARDAGVRVVHPRSGVVLARSGGALPRMLLPFRFGVGGRLGSGHQWMSWITRHDHIRALRFLIDTEGIEGPVNLTAPAPVTNRELARAIGRALRRPSIVPAPAFALRLALGRELVDSLLLVSQRARPAALEAAGFRFDQPEIDEGLQAALTS